MRDEVQEYLQGISAAKTLGNMLSA